ncbi:hypothetical protein [Streptomyces sp. ME19-01-6]|uniref:hypothetical protein n=1 Tax=Streptomyces sp. ME19-01-6 TaxID=3028686 RepID=UPI0029B7B44C|nr:hypothetical protein [Streptomyces sp. ME19-01-6]MDX3225240.1 hypothetical protein [Streptomyces sp. ME19-01-6]
MTDTGDPSCDHPEPWRHGVYHHCSAAGVEWDWVYNPVAVIPNPSGATGELFVKGLPRGSVSLLGKDHVDFGAMSSEAFSACRQAIFEGLEVLRSRNTYVVVEGAGSLSQHAPEIDLANRMPALLANLPVIVVSSLKHFGSLVSHGLNFDPELFTLFRALMVNGVDPTNAFEVDQSLHRFPAEVPTGWTPQVVYPPYDGTATARQVRYRLWADIMREYLPDVSAPLELGSAVSSPENATEKSVEWT